jgi:superfamily II DNA/RNA helicase
MKVESVAIYGGVDVQTQIQQLGFSGRLGKKGNSRRLLNVAATSGRLLDILKQCAQRDDASGVESTSVASAFSSTQIFVFNEADRIAVNPEMSLQVDEILSILKDERDDDDITTCIVSATLPEKARETCDKWVRLPRVVVKVGSVKVAEKKRTDDDSTKDVSAIAGDTRTKLPDDLDLASIPSHIVQTLHVCSTHKKPKKLILTLQRIYAKPKNPHGGRSSTNNKLCIVFFAQIKTLKFASKLLAKEGMLL